MTGEIFPPATTNANLPRSDMRGRASRDGGFTRSVVARLDRAIQ
jgi:hypothetical protein